MKKRLRLWFAAALGAFHLVIIGGAILEAAWTGEEGLGYVLGIYDFPLFALCQYSPGFCKWLPPYPLVLLLVAGTLMYALIGFIIGAAIDWIRALIAHCWGEAQK